MQQPSNQYPKEQWQQSPYPSQQQGNKFQPPMLSPEKARKGLFIILGVILAVSLVGCIVVVVSVNQFFATQKHDYEIHRSTSIAENDATNEAQQATSEAQQATQAVPIPTNASLSFSGVGQQASHIIWFQHGLAIFTFTHDGTSNFIVQLKYTKSQIVYYLANAIGSFDGSKAEGITNAGAYVLDIQADGKWTVTIQQPRPTTAPYTTSFRGKGQVATELFSMQSGLKTIKMTHNGTSIFNVRLFDSQGNVVDYLTIGIGKLNGSKAEDIQNDGIYLFDVQADGNWTISIQ